MAKKRIRTFDGLLLIFFTLAGLVFFFAPQSVSNKFQMAFAHVFRRPLSCGRNFLLSVQPQSAHADAISQSRYNQLRNNLANTAQWLHQERQKVEKLSGICDRPVWKGARFVIADIITTSIGDTCSEMIINRGEHDGLSEGQFVLGEYSVIGTVSDVGSRTAKVRLTTDPASKAAVKIADLDLSVIMQGQGNDLAKVQLLSLRYKIKIDDIVYVQKKAGFLDVPMIAGRIVELKSDDENPLLWDITVSPACETANLKDVTVIIMNPESNYDSMPATKTQ